MAQITKMIMMECITNLHVGDGDINYNIVDNEVQKDPILNMPTIHSSGVKGAFRAYFDSLGKNFEEKTTRIFGSSANVKKDDMKNPGELKFFSGDCFLLAMRNSRINTTCSHPFSLVTTKNTIENMTGMMSVFGMEEKAKDISSILPILSGNIGISFDKGVEEIEGEKVKSAQLNSGLRSFFNEYIKCSKPEQIGVLSTSFFENYQLPVNARNQLKDMKSNNLWYEEFVPHHSVFYTFVRGENDLVNEFCNLVNGEIIQFGANASIGFGLMRLRVVEG